MAEMLTQEFQSPDRESQEEKSGFGLKERTFGKSENFLIQTKDFNPLSSNSAFKLRKQLYNKHHG